MEEKQIRASTKRRYALVVKAVRERLGKMPVMMVYLEVAQEMGLAEETVRRIMWKKKKQHKCEIHQQKRGFMCIFALAFGKQVAMTDALHR